MKWSERQLAMLREMGIRLWPVGAIADPAAEVSTADAELAVEAAATTAPVEAVAMRQAVVDPPRARTAGPVSVATLMPLPDRVAPGALTGERAPRIASMSFDELAATASSCTACRLCESRRQVVFGVGNPHADWMIVGDAPGEMEDEMGEPFVGKPGQLLDNMLLACGLRRAPSPGGPEKQVFITNALKCRARGNSNPTPEELARCEPYLIRQIELIKPKVIVAMGRYAVQSLLHSTEPLGKLRGRVHRAHGAPEVPVVVTYHPAFLLRNQEDKAKAWEDLCLAMDLVRG